MNDTTTNRAPGRPRSERAEKAIIEATLDLLAAESGVAGVSIEAVAARAGVGKGTVFRRFGDRASLARAVLSEHESQLQEAMIRGEPPLGPGAPARERLIAFGRAYLEFLDSHAELLLAAEGSETARLASNVYAMYRTHVGVLLEQAGCGERPRYLADVLMAPLGAPTFLHHRQGSSVKELQAAYEDLVARVID
jgi:AcrR family transcriptional regulator